MKKLLFGSFYFFLLSTLFLPVYASTASEAPVIPQLGNGDGILIDGLALFLVAAILFGIIVLFYRILNPKSKPGGRLKRK